MTYSGQSRGGTLAGLKGHFSIINASKKELPRGSQFIVRGQIQTIAHAFAGLLTGLVFAIALVYLLIVMNFHRGLTPSSFLWHCPPRLAGLVWFLS